MDKEVSRWSRYHIWEWDLLNFGPKAASRSPLCGERGRPKSDDIDSNTEAMTISRNVLSVTYAMPVQDSQLATKPPGRFPSCGEWGALQSIQEWRCTFQLLLSFFVCIIIVPDLKQNEIHQYWIVPFSFGNSFILNSNEQPKLNSSIARNLFGAVSMQCQQINWVTIKTIEEQIKSVCSSAELFSRFRQKSWS